MIDGRYCLVDTLEVLAKAFQDQSLIATKADNALRTILNRIQEMNIIEEVQTDNSYENMGIKKDFIQIL